MALLSFSSLFQFTLRAACVLTFTLLFTPHVVMAQTAPSPSGGAPSDGGLFPEFNEAATKAFKTAERVAKGVSNAAKVVDGFVTIEGEKDEEREREAARKAHERMQRVSEKASSVDEYMELRARQDAYERGDPGAGKLRVGEKTRLNVLEKRVVGEWRESQIALWEAQNGRTWDGGKWPGDFGSTYRVAQAISPSNPGQVLAAGAGLQEYFTHILTAPIP